MDSDISVFPFLQASGTTTKAHQKGKHQGTISNQWCTTTDRSSTLLWLMIGIRRSWCNQAVSTVATNDCIINVWTLTHQNDQSWGRDKDWRCRWQSSIQQCVIQSVNYLTHYRQRNYQRHSQQYSTLREIIQQKLHNDKQHSRTKFVDTFCVIFKSRYLIAEAVKSVHVSTIIK